MYNETLYNETQERYPKLNRTPLQSGIVGFPSSFAAFKYLESMAVGPVSWKLNGNPNVQRYDSFDSETGYVDDDKEREYETASHLDDYVCDVPCILPVLSRVNIVDTEDELEARRRWL